MPNTLEGKVKVSLNAVQHGLTSNKMYVLQNENPEAWAQLLADCMNDYNPQSNLERAHVEAIAFSLWRLRRVYSVQTAAIDLEMDDQAEMFAEKFASADETVRKTLAMRTLMDESQSLSRFARYETALQRAHDRAVQNFLNIRRLRAEPRLGQDSKMGRALSPAKNYETNSPEIGDAALLKRDG